METKKASDIINDLIEQKKLSAASFAKKLGYERAQIIYDIQKGKTKRISHELANKIISVYPDIDRDYLLTGSINRSTGEIYSTSKQIPFWNLPVSAGKSITDIIGSTKPDGYIKGLPGADIAENILPVAGASMEPEVTNGAIIGVRKMENWETLNTERIYLIITRDDRMIKRIEHDLGDANILWCVSPSYPRFKIFKSEIIEIQRVCFVYNPK